MAAQPLRTSPGLAFLLGLLPGVGAIYNAQYLKGFMHVAIFGLLVTLISSGHGDGGGEAFLGILVAAWWAYMPFEAYHTAKRRQLGMPVDEWSSLLPKERGIRSRADRPHRVNRAGRDLSLLVSLT